MTKWRDAGDSDDRALEGPNRRTVLKAGAGAAFGVGVARYGVGMAQEATDSATPAATTAVCAVTSEVTEGPYYLAQELIRSDITEGLPGVPMTLRIGVTDVASCAPLANAAVDIWHCDAQGYYSGISGENPGGGGEATNNENLTTTFLRGVQITDADGFVEFQTIFPGWYTGRTVHIHMKVHVDGEVGAAGDDPDAAATPAGGQTYQGGHVSHTGQLFFDDELAELVFATDAYARESDSGRIFNGEDNILGDHDDDPSFMTTTTLVNDDAITDGILATVTVGVDPSATSTETGMGGGGMGAPGGMPPAGGPGGQPPASETATS
jgi:protocatechuate 3,4-dioxygenase beta subunit